MKTRTAAMIVALSATALLGLGGAGVVSTAADAAPPRAAVDDEGARVNPTLTGTWRAQVTRQDCATFAPGPTFPALLTFEHKGTLIETTAAVAPSQRTPGHGFWSQTGPRQFTAVSEAFLFSPAAIWTGTQRITQMIMITGQPQQVTSNATFEILDTAGNLVASGCASAVLTKMD